MATIGIQPELLGKWLQSTFVNGYTFTKPNSLSVGLFSALPSGDLDSFLKALQARVSATPQPDFCYFLQTGNLVGGAYPNLGTRGDRVFQPNVIFAAASPVADGGDGSFVTSSGTRLRSLRFTDTSFTLINSFYDAIKKPVGTVSNRNMGLKFDNNSGQSNFGITVEFVVRSTGAATVTDFIPVFTQCSSHPTVETEPSKEPIMQFFIKRKMPNLIAAPYISTINPTTGMRGTTNFGVTEPGNYAAGSPYFLETGSNNTFDTNGTVSHCIVVFRMHKGSRGVFFYINGKKYDVTPPGFAASTNEDSEFFMDNAIGSFIPLTCATGAGAAYAGNGSDTHHLLYDYFAAYPEAMTDADIMKRFTYPLSGEVASASYGRDFSLSFDYSSSQYLVSNAADLNFGTPISGWPIVKYVAVLDQDNNALGIAELPNVDAPPPVSQPFIIKKGILRFMLLNQKLG